MGFTNDLDKQIAQFEEFERDNPEHKLLFKLFVAELKLLRKAYFEDK